MTQPQREAILDLVILSLFADSHLSLKEDTALQHALDKIGWEALKPRDIFFMNSMRRAHIAVQTEADKTAYIQSRAKEISGVWTKTETLSLLQSVISSDGVTTDENVFLSQVKAALA